MSPEKMTMAELKDELVKVTKTAKEKIAPMLFYLRLKLKAPGNRRGLGFGAWVEKNLTFTRRTADLWANEWGEAQGLITKKNSTFGKHSKGWGASAKDNDDLCSVEFALPYPEERRAFRQAAAILSREKRLTTVIYEAVLAAAKVKKPNARSKKNANDSRLAKSSDAAASRRSAAVA